MKKQNFENYKLDLVDNKRFSSISEFEFVKDPRKNKTQLGVGSFGEVRLAVHKKSGVKFAIKIMNLKNMNSFQEIQGIEREVRVHSILKHPNIIEYHDSFQENEFVYIVLDYASNGNLYSLLYKKRCFNEKEAFRFFCQTCEAIQYLHSINIVHRDLKPENILLDEEFNIKVCDFGWCTEDIENPRNTFCGTYEYMAPEIVFRKPYDYRIDIWALGILMYELLHGCAPFKGKTFKEIHKKIDKGDVQFSDAISDLSKQLICKILQANPQRRISIEDIMSHSWMQKMRQVDKDEKKSNDNTKNSTNLGKSLSPHSNNKNTGSKYEDNDQPKVKELQQLQKKPDNRSQSPMIANQKSSNNLLMVANEMKSNEKENIAAVVYASNSNVELSERKKTNTPNKTTASIPKKEYEGFQAHQKKLFSNSKSSNNVGLSMEFPKIMFTEPQAELQYNQKEVFSAQKLQILSNNEANQVRDCSREKSCDYNSQQQQSEVKKVRAGKSITPTNGQHHSENMFKNFDQKDLNQINNIAKKQQQEMMKMNSNYQSQQALHHHSNNYQGQDQFLQVDSSKQIIATETAYSKDIDENSIKNSQKTINTSRFVNKHGSLHGNSVQHHHQSSITNSISANSNQAHGSNNIALSRNGINISQALQQKEFFNQTDEIKFHKDHNTNISYTKTEGNQYIGNSYLGNKNINTNTSMTQDEPCFSLFGCLGPSHISTTQRNRDNSSSNQRLQAKQTISNHAQSQQSQHNQSLNSVYSSFANQGGENRPRINSTNMIPTQSFLKQQSSTPIHHQSSVSSSQQYSTVIQQQPLNADKNAFSTQRSSNSLTNKVSNYSFLGQQQQSNNQVNSQYSTNAKISNSYLSQIQQQQSQQQLQQQQAKQPLGDKTNLPVSAIPTKQINLQDERKYLQKLQTSTNNNNGKQENTNTNNNSFISNQYVTKERSLTQDCLSLQNQYQNLGQAHNTNSAINGQKLNTVTQTNPSNSSYQNLKMDNSKIGNNEISRSNRTGQRSRTLIFEELNTEKTKSVIESMEQMISFVRNALPFSSTSQQSICIPTNQNATPLGNIQNPFSNFSEQYNNLNDVSYNANVSVLQNVSMQKINSTECSSTPVNNLSHKQSASSKQIININNMKSQRIEQNQVNNHDSQKSHQLLQKQNSLGYNNVNTTNSSHRNKQKIFEGKGNNNNSSSFHSNHTPLQSISNLNNVSVNNYFTQKTSPNIQSYSNIIPQGQMSKQQHFNSNNDCSSINKFGNHLQPQINNQNSQYYQ